MEVQKKTISSSVCAANARLSVALAAVGVGADRAAEHARIDAGAFLEILRVGATRA